MQVNTLPILILNRSMWLDLPRHVELLQNVTYVKLESIYVELAWYYDN